MIVPTSTVNLPLTGTTQQVAIQKTQNFRQAGEFYRSLSSQEQKNLISNLSGDLKDVTNAEIQYTMLSHFYKADADYGMRLAKAVGADSGRVAVLASKLAD